MKCLVRINTIAAVKEFVDICIKYDFGIYLLDGNYVIDAKSIMGVFCLNLCKDITLEAECSDENKLGLLSDLRNFVVEV